MSSRMRMRKVSNESTTSTSTTMTSACTVSGLDYGSPVTPPRYSRPNGEFKTFFLRNFYKILVQALNFANVLVFKPLLDNIFFLFWPSTINQEAPGYSQQFFIRYRLINPFLGPG